MDPTQIGPDQMQKCRACGELKPLSDFDVRADSGKRRTHCRNCRRVYQNARNGRLHPPASRPARVVGAPELLKCTRCGELKPAGAFPRRRRGGEKLQTWCRDCFAEVNDRRYRVMHESELARLRLNVEATRHANQQAVLAYLATHPCVDCGDADPIVLEFDHLGPKKADVSKLVNSGTTWPVIAAEIAKCVVRCANCHRIRTGQRAATEMIPIQLALPNIYAPAPAISDSSVPRDTSGMRVCRRCKLVQPSSAFGFRSFERGVRTHICRTCQSDYHREWYQRSRAAILKRSRRNRRRLKRHRGATRIKFWQYLLAHPCVDCGEADIRVLDLDHLRDKKAEVGALVRAGASWARVLEEIEKCEVRCANCHRRRTSGLMGGYRVRSLNTPT